MEKVKSVNPVSRAKSEKSYQTGIERMQIAILLKKVGATAIAQRAAKELETLRKNVVTAREKGQELVSKYDTLLSIYNTDLKPLTLEVLQEKAKMNALRFVKRAQGEVTEAQEAIVSQYFALKAEADFAIREQVEGVLSMKGLLKAQTKEASKSSNKKEKAVA